MLNKNQKSNTNNKDNSFVFQPDTFFRGQLNFHSPIVIQGKFEGDIEGDQPLEVGKNGNIEASIKGTVVIVLGKVVGNISASEKVELRTGASVTGNIRTPNLEMQEGVIFEGQCETKPKETQSPSN